MKSFRKIRFFHALLAVSVILFFTSALTRAVGHSWGRINLARTHFGRSIPVNDFDSPLDIPNIKHWFTADYGIEGDSSQMPADNGDVVFFWRDQTSNSNDAYQGTNANRFVFKTGVHNGNSGLQADGIDDFMNVPGNGTAGEFTYFFVLSSTQTGRNIVISHHAATYGRGHVIFNSATNRALFYLGSSNFQYFLDFSAQDDGNPHLFEAYIAGAGQNDIDNAELWADGVEISKDGSPTKSGTVSPWSDLLIGKFKVSSYHYGDFTLSEFVIVAGSVSTADRQALERLWSDKYGYSLP